MADRTTKDVLSTIPDAISSAFKDVMAKTPFGKEPLPKGGSRTVAEEISIATGKESQDQKKSIGKMSIQYVKPQRDRSRSSKALVWNGTKSVEIQDLGVPQLMEPGDAIVRMTMTCVCGSDLHMYANEVPGGHVMEKGDVLGHEGVGIVEEVGVGVKKFKKGDRVVIAFAITCGDCRFCKKQMYTLCDTTNPSVDMKKLYGQNLAGVFGYSHLTGGFDGLQAEHARVPLADNNMHIIPDSIPDNKALLVSDVCCTAWHGNELTEVNNETESVAVWGAGPVGLLAAYFAKFRGAKRVVIVDHNEWRLERARKVGVETVNLDHVNVSEELLKMFPDGIEKCIDCVGYRFPKSALHKALRAAKIETDSPEVIQDMMKVCQKGGQIALIGDYFGTANNFPIGAMMEKSFTIRGGQAFVQKYWDQMLSFLEKGQIDPTFVESHCVTFDDMPKAYEIFYNRQDEIVKPIMTTRFSVDKTGEYMIPPKKYFNV